ncbi:MAG: hypothetical protein HQM03_07595 [Magnetococcales bacterium]|nr:hypothetical protein [Magnetococcales bacterium]
MMENPEWISWLVLLGGGVVTLLGLFKIIVSSARLMVWLVLLTVGLTGMAYGVRHHPDILVTIGVPPETVRSIHSMLAPGK